MSSIYNFFSFLEDKEGKVPPIRVQSEMESPLYEELFDKLSNVGRDILVPVAQISLVENHFKDYLLEYDYYNLIRNLDTFFLNYFNYMDMRPILNKHYGDLLGDSDSYIGYIHENRKKLSKFRSLSIPIKEVDPKFYFFDIISKSGKSSIQIDIEKVFEYYKAQKGISNSPLDFFRTLIYYKTVYSYTIKLLESLDYVEFDSELDDNDERASTVATADVLRAAGVSTGDPKDFGLGGSVGLVSVLTMAGGRNIKDGYHSRINLTNPKFVEYVGDLVLEMGD